MNPTPGAIYTGLGNAIATISRVEGYMSLWRGLSSVVLGAGQIRPSQLHQSHNLTWIMQAQHTPSTLRHTRSSSKKWAVMPLATTRSQQVNNYIQSPHALDRDREADATTATSGACATIASDAFMNPFDGVSASVSKDEIISLMRLYSHQAAHASTRLNLQLRLAMCPRRLPQ